MAKKKPIIFNPKTPEIISNVEVQNEVVEPRDFDQWFAEVLVAKKLNPSIKEAIRKHFKNRGFLDNGKFEEGLKDFGL